MKKGDHRPTEAELEKRVDDVEVLLSRHARRSQIHKVICEKYKVDWRTVERYVSRARARLLARLNETKNEHRSMALAVYQQVVMSGTPREKVLAQERIDKLLGLEAPRQIGLGGDPSMPPIRTETTDTTPRPLAGASKADLLAIIKLAQNASHKKAKPGGA